MDAILGSPDFEETEIATEEAPSMPTGKFILKVVAEIVSALPADM